MSKQGIKRPDRTHVKERNTLPPVPEIQGKAKSGKEKANPIIEGAKGSETKVYHTTPHKAEREISSAYPAIDTDLARDNMENDLPQADLKDL